MIYRGEPLDILSTLDFQGRYPLMEAVVHLAHRLNIPRLKAAVTATASVVPEIYGGYSLKRNRFDTPKRDDLTVVQEYASFQDPERASLDLLAGPQLQVQVIHHDDADVLRIFISHLVTDGVGFKNYLYLLAAAYNGDDISTIRNDRSVRSILAGLKKRSHVEVDQEETEIASDWQPIPGGVHYHNGKITIGQRSFKRIEQASQTHDFSVEEVVLAAYAKAINVLTGKQRLQIPFPVNLRQFNPARFSDQTVQIANLTGQLLVSVQIHIYDTFDTILQRVHDTIETMIDQQQYLNVIPALQRLSRWATPDMMRRMIARNQPLRHVSFEAFGEVDANRFMFDQIPVAGVYLTDSFRTMPDFRLTMSSFNDSCTLSFRMLGSEQDYQQGLKVLNNMESTLTMWAQKISQD
ncbi:hypothetical protein [Levilactobacillus bambusae]|uniref:Condensation domain-containing protein n=1 Tax=Levilactobacillus bambusae TaxID=2024736 RepID=A0A2V1N0J1_9LACO|nr:hypothetical protein [Levilactobacillus bambusae]PWG00533.1 hypothetical protein DCM90_06315 [Levilactobacillus bambusae]